MNNNHTSLFGPAQAARYLNMTHHRLARLQEEGCGPRHFLYQGERLYTLADLDEWTPPESPKKPADPPSSYSTEALREEWECWGHAQTAEFLGISGSYLNRLRAERLDPASLPPEWVQRRAAMYPAGAVRAYKEKIDHLSQQSFASVQDKRREARALSQQWVRENPDAIPPSPAEWLQTQTAGGAR